MRINAGLCAVLGAGLISLSGVSCLAEELTEVTVEALEETQSEIKDEFEQEELENTILTDATASDLLLENVDSNIIEEETVAIENSYAEKNETVTESESENQTGDTESSGQPGQENENESDKTGEPSTEPVSEQNTGESEEPDTNKGEGSTESPSSEGETTPTDDGEGVDLDLSDLGLDGSGGEKDKKPGTSSGQSTNDGDQPGKGTPQNVTGSGSNSSGTVVVEVNDDAPQSRYTSYQNENTSGGSSEVSGNVNVSDDVAEQYNKENLDAYNAADNTDYSQDGYETTQSSTVYFSESEIPTAARLRYNLYSSIKAFVSSITNTSTTGTNTTGSGGSTVSGSQSITGRQVLAFLWNSAPPVFRAHASYALKKYF